MKIFVAGGTGVVGRAGMKALVEAGHQVRSTARNDEKAQLVRELGAEPVRVDLYDPKEVRQAIAGCEAVLRLTTKIPPMAKMRSHEAWQETNLLRTEGARILVDGAIAEGVKLYVHESVTFVYADGGPEWITEDSPTDDGESDILRSALEGEKEAARFSGSGGRGIVLQVPKPFRLPGIAGKASFGDVWSYLSRSHRVSGARFKQASGWQPSVASVAEGWRLVAATLKPAVRAKAKSHF